eukprot:COSAG06_NODE_177_length_21031_cov_13.839528_17_plen_185_part_00
MRASRCPSRAVTPPSSCKCLQLHRELRCRPPWLHQWRIEEANDAIILQLPLHCRILLKNSPTPRRRRRCCCHYRYLHPAGFTRPDRETRILSCNERALVSNGCQGLQGYAPLVQLSSRPERTFSASTDCTARPSVSAIDCTRLRARSQRYAPISLVRTPCTQRAEQSRAEQNGATTTHTHTSGN